MQTTWKQINMSKYTKQWLKLLKAEALHKRKAVRKHTEKLFDKILDKDIPNYLAGKRDKE